MRVSKGVRFAAKLDGTSAALRDFRSAPPGPLDIQADAEGCQAEAAEGPDKWRHWHDERLSSDLSREPHVRDDVARSDHDAGDRRRYVRDLDRDERPLLLRVEETAKLLNIGVSSVYRLIEQRVLPSARFGRSVRVPRAALERWVQEHTQEADR